jgi:hypothetical protein
MEVDKLPVSNMPVSKVRAPRFCGWAYLFAADADHGDALVARWLLRVGVVPDCRPAGNHNFVVIRRGPEQRP